MYCYISIGLLNRHSLQVTRYLSVRLLRLLLRLQPIKANSCAQPMQKILLHELVYIVMQRKKVLHHNSQETIILLDFYY